MKIKTVGHNNGRLSYCEGTLRYICFSLGWLYIFHRHMLYAIFSGVGMDGLAEIFTVEKESAGVTVATRYVVILSMYVAPLFIVGKTLPDYLSRARVVSIDTARPV